MNFVSSPLAASHRAEKKLSPVIVAQIPFYLLAISFASISMVVGVIWDISWHMSIGRDGFFSPPHILIYLGGIFGGAFSGIQVLWNTFGAAHAVRSNLIKVWGLFYSSLGSLLCIWGAVAMLTAAPFDDWWHNTYGLDVVILSPPHALLITGILSLIFGACIHVTRCINLHEASGDTSEQGRLRLKIYRVLYIIAASSFLCLSCVLLTEYISTRNQHHAQFYKITGVIFLLFLPAFSQAMRLKWGMTWISVGYLLILGVSNWVLQQFPAEPKLGPILNPITHFQPMPFPILFFIPAILMDFIMQKPKLNNWTKAVLLSAVFIVLLLLVQYPLSQFLLESPMARNKFFGSDSWVYSADPNWVYRYHFTSYENQPVNIFVKGIIQALIIGFVAACVSLHWGKWMKNIIR